METLSAKPETSIASGVNTGIETPTKTIVFCVNRHLHRTLKRAQEGTFWDPSAEVILLFEPGPMELSSKVEGRLDRESLDPILQAGILRWEDIPASKREGEHPRGRVIVPYSQGLFTMLCWRHFIPDPQTQYLAIISGTYGWQGIDFLVSLIHKLARSGCVYEVWDSSRSPTEDRVQWDQIALRD